jgi:hypothetical protein
MRNIHTLALAAFSLLVGEASSYAQNQLVQVPFTQSSAIQGEPLDPERAKVLLDFNNLPSQKQTRSALTGGFCGAR